MQICHGNGMRLGLLVLLLFILACLMTLSVVLNIQPVGEAGNIELERMWKRVTKMYSCLCPHHKGVCGKRKYDYNNF